jgi:hypothetical protein
MIGDRDVIGRGNVVEREATIGIDEHAAAADANPNVRRRPSFGQNDAPPYGLRFRWRLPLGLIRDRLLRSRLLPSLHLPSNHRSHTNDSDENPDEGKVW